MKKSFPFLSIFIINFKFEIRITITSIHVNFFWLDYLTTKKLNEYTIFYTFIYYYNMYYYYIEQL